MSEAHASQDAIITVRPAAEVFSRQELPYFVGVSKDTTGATGISMNLIVIPPGGAARAHLHCDHETAIYILEGDVQTLYGADLQHSTINHAGDFLFIPADLPHQPVNLNTDRPARAIVARNDPDEQQSVVLHSGGERPAP